MIAEKITYDIFARINRGDNLMHIGTVEAENSELAKVYATFTYDEEDWTEMVVVERNKLNWVKKPDWLFSEKGAEAL
ncbi:MAG: hypothetical protein C6W58_11730 [Bacillaceae bacterium]|jgi:hypothetical protein|uniref:Phenylacetic acid degradation B n=2 Tax=Aeribacillus TaxID=1055323 RepID=A0A161Y181_9BACI|nr:MULTISPECIES: hypothetical protein [Aeribacillus]REJ15137.1 MAG: hypothetical protein C6W58_11730 [Bacillaceae bacterium]ASS90720.1 hypothetical protein AP3564_11260 [Aeribacillus pallidus]KZM53639.1 hypothetical protein A3Q35_16635 [Aeribacillus pallidus]KZN95382.1 hypothetical protein AZI98_14335 [Aeribacillus pallidus]MDR9793426.1 hypothetical protein [Aeribacillus pallidus]